MSTVGFFLPYIGMTHQEYLWRSYQGIKHKKKIISFNVVNDNSWSSFHESAITLWPTSFHFKFFNKLIRNFFFFLNPKRHIFMPFPPIGWKKKMYNAIEEQDIKVLIINYAASGISLLPLFNQIKKRTKIIISFEGSDFQMADHNLWYKSKIERLVQFADLCVFISKFLMKQALDRGCPVKKSRCIYRGCPYTDVIKMSHPIQAKKFVTVANLFPVKGHLYLIKAFSEVSKYIPEATLTLYGTGNEYKNIYSQVKNYGIENKVIFKGKRRWDEIQNSLPDYDIYIQPSIKSEDGQEESFCQATLEATLKGLPVIATDSGGLPEIVDNGRTGIVVKQKNSTELFRAMLNLSNSRELRYFFSDQGIKKSKKEFTLEKHHFLWNQLISQYL